jgi:surfactin synthase thioesterase subunit
VVGHSMGGIVAFDLAARAAISSKEPAKCIHQR